MLTTEGGARAVFLEARAPRPVSRGAKLQVGYLGPDSLYLVLEYPHADVYKRWANIAGDLDSDALREGVPSGAMVIRRGLLGYKLSVWEGDARLLMTDRVNDSLAGTALEGQGMGLMLQLGPRWLQRYGNILSEETFRQNIFAQFSSFGVFHPAQYPVRLNRIDIALDVIGLQIADFSIDEWRDKWVGHAKRKDFHDCGQATLEGFSIGRSTGAVRFKVYDKVRESLQDGDYGFWWSVWDVSGVLELGVTRFEWSIRPYAGRFEGMRYLSDFTYDGFVSLLNYASYDWGRLCTPQDDDENRSRWPLHPLWAELRRLIEEWGFEFDETARRSYHYMPDLKEAYLRSFSGWLAGLMARAGIELGKDGPANQHEALALLAERGFPPLEIAKLAHKKWDIYSRLAREVKS